MREKELKFEIYGVTALDVFTKLNERFLFMSTIVTTGHDTFYGHDNCDFIRVRTNDFNDEVRITCKDTDRKNITDRFEADIKLDRSQLPAIHAMLTKMCGKSHHKVEAKHYTSWLEGGACITVYENRNLYSAVILEVEADTLAEVRAICNEIPQEYINIPVYKSWYQLTYAETMEAINGK